MSGIKFTRRALEMVLLSLERIRDQTVTNSLRVSIGWNSLVLQSNSGQLLLDELFPRRISCSPIRLVDTRRGRFDQERVPLGIRCERFFRDVLNQLLVDKRKLFLGQRYLLQYPTEKTSRFLFVARYIYIYISRSFSKVGQQKK